MDEPDYPSADQPLNAPRRRPTLGPLLVVLAVFVAILALFALITVTR